MMAEKPEMNLIKSFLISGPGNKKTVSFTLLQVKISILSSLPGNGLSHVLFLKAIVDYLI